MMKRRRQAQTEEATIDSNLDAMLDSAVVEAGDGAWGFPVVLVRKKDGSVRFCVDYRALNKVTKRDVYPLPRIDETLEALGGTRLFTTLDLRSGYWQIKVPKGDRDKTAFITKRGHYRFKRMLFGLTNAPATFQRLMNGVLYGLTWSTCLVYLDDIVVFAKGGVERHIVDLATVLERLSNAGLTLKIKKCVFAAEEMEYLGHNLSSDGVRPVERLLGKFIKGFGSLATPMTRLLKKDVEW
ncbi:Gag-pol fusion protein [Phytophthora megakarya]|uniref:Gag-pol fusion protein n=1 Tax=Phytophthora megakarya TaxID=4795 RepID=A0A225UC41_9STRA|nr:Gag-pol fusion protein [Phytophthora megakarya]